MTILETVLISLLVAVISGLVGKAIGTNGTIKKPLCDQIRRSCQDLLLEKIKGLEDKVEALTAAVNSKLLGIG